MFQLGIGIIQNTWFGLANRDENKQPILLPAHAETLAKAALQSCDHLDGLVDGLIDNPDLCTIDFGLVMCDSPRSIVNSSACLTNRELDVAKKFYSAPTDSKGNVILSVGALPGSESYWDRQGWLGSTRHPKGSGESATLGNLIDRWNNIAFDVDPAPLATSIAELDLDLDTLYQRVGYMESMFSASNADLTVFKRLGGKLILSQGWPDVNVPAHFLVDYYRRLVHVFGEAETESFVKLFMSNGQNHVQSYGLGASAGQDPYSRIAEWVEDGVSPMWFNGTKYDATNGTFLFSRPAFPFPYYAMYDGVGDPNVQESFYPVKRLTLFGNPISS
jgi:feruloyl esterase